MVRWAYCALIAKAIGPTGDFNIKNWYGITYQDPRYGIRNAQDGVE